MANDLLPDLVQTIHKTAASHHDDRGLLQDFATHNDQAAFAELLRRHGGMVLGVCLRVLNSTHDAEDAFQAVSLVLVRKAGTIENGEALAGWQTRPTPCARSEPSKTDPWNLRRMVQLHHRAGFGALGDKHERLELLKA